MRIVLLIFAFASTGLAATAPDLAPVRQWLERQQSIKSISSDFIQTRALRSLRSPAVTSGKFWFHAPSSFRWQIGDPPKTIVLGNARMVDVIQPGKKIAGRSSAEGVGAKARSRGFDFISFPLAANFDEFQRQFEILEVQTKNGRCHLELLPHNPQARRFLSKLTLDFEIASGQLLAFEIATRDGSSMRTEFRNTEVNSPLDPALFRYDLTGYEIRDAK
jgi:outer membrane lipoprotein carrier protein